MVRTIHLVQNFIHESTRFFDWDRQQIFTENDFKSTLEAHRINYEENASEIPYIPRILPIPMFNVDIFGLSAVNVSVDWSKFTSD